MHTNSPILEAIYVELKQAFAGSYNDDLGRYEDQAEVILVDIYSREPDALRISIYPQGFTSEGFIGKGLPAKGVETFLVAGTVVARSETLAYDLGAVLGKIQKTLATSDALFKAAGDGAAIRFQTIDPGFASDEQAVAFFKLIVQIQTLKRWKS